MCFQSVCGVVKRFEKVTNGYKRLQSRYFKRPLEFEENSSATDARMADAEESRSLAERSGFVDGLQHVLLFADWRARGAAPCVCTTWRNTLFPDKSDSQWQWLCERLRDENRLYLPAGTCPSVDGWRAHFDKLWAQRNLWKVDEKAIAAAGHGEVDEAWRPQQQLSEESFNVSVAVRFRPAVETAGGKDAATAEGDVVVMPLHQRVAMVRAKHGCSQAKAMRIVMKQEAAAKKKAGVAEMELEECTVAVGKAMSQSQIDLIEARQRQAAEAHVAAEDHEDMERTRRLKPHIYGARHKSREPSFANGYTTNVVPSSRVEAAMFDQVAQAEAEAVVDAADAVAARNLTESRGLVMVRNIPAGVTPADLVAFCNEPAAAAAVADTESAVARGVLGGEQGIHLIVPDSATAGDAGVSSADPVTSCEAFVEFGSSDEADVAMAFLDGRKLLSNNVEVFRATEEHMAAVLKEARDKERAAAARRAEEARAAAEARRLETIAAARAARAAEKERHRLDAERLKEAKAKAAEAEAAGTSPYGLADGKENSPEKSAEEEAAAAEKAKVANNTKAAIVNVSSEKAEVLAMAPGCGLRPFNFECVFDSDAKQEHVYEMCGRAAVADVLNGHSACVLVYGQTGAGKVNDNAARHPACCRAARPACCLSSAARPELTTVCFPRATHPLPRVCLPRSRRTRCSATAPQTRGWVHPLAATASSRASARR